jgi:hypothetical protein
MGSFAKLFTHRLTNAHTLTTIFEMFEKFCCLRNVGAQFNKELMLLKGRYFTNSNSILL